MSEACVVVVVASSFPSPPPLPFRSSVPYEELASSERLSIEATSERAWPGFRLRKCFHFRKRACLGEVAAEATPSDFASTSNSAVVLFPTRKSASRHCSKSAVESLAKSFETNCKSCCVAAIASEDCVWVEDAAVGRRVAIAKVARTTTKSCFAQDRAKASVAAPPFCDTQNCCSCSMIRRLRWESGRNRF